MAVERSRWSELGDRAVPLDYDELARLSGLGEPVGMDEIDEVYLPLARLLELRIEAAKTLSAAQGEFLGDPEHAVPFLLALGGSVAVGKSTAARLIVRLLQAIRPEWHVELVTTDGFLLPNATLIEKGILARKGFPESYDRRRLLRFVADLKSGVDEVRAPVYSHLIYDIVEDEQRVVRRPDVVVLEGVNVLKRGSGRVYVSDFADFALYLDAEEADVQRWYLNRFLTLRNGAFQDPDSYFHRYAVLSDEEATAVAEGIWQRTNRPNLLENIKPTRSRADLILEKGGDHFVSRILLRRT
ncbi:type I pantothenate kinase [Solirubrobacter phytolaccae]|uniref:Pantothenate kinase n=1 Tax=Solirubrobacter phytolaccae TaxID=1404360 RepID=A0A9X3N4W9_9ACTN|nr:type I pantothenate kinase [Solirubrobacter phytolaccae]MDA0179551.1 type I pantothenate kinase [Solirubrobacter phytolaccae]